MNARRIVSAGLLALLALATSSAAVADYAAGKAAYEAGDYAGALAAWTRGGAGGDGLSLFGLGRLHQAGQAVPAGPIKAHAYYNMSSALGVGPGGPARDSLAALMSPADVATAQQLAQDMLRSRQFVIDPAPAATASAPRPAAPQPPAPRRDPPRQDPPRQDPPPQTASAPRPAQPARAVSVGRLSLDKACEHVLTWSDRGSGGASDISLYDPQPESGQFAVGGYPQTDYNSARGCVTTVAAGTTAAGAAPPLAPPARWQMLWEDRGTGANLDGAIWQAVPPSQDYVCIGHMAETGYSTPRPPPYACVHRCLVRAVSVGPPVWTDRGTGARTRVAIYQLPNSGVFRAVTGGSPPGTFLDLDPTGSSCQVQ